MKNENLRWVGGYGKNYKTFTPSYFCVGIVGFAVSRDAGCVEIVNKWLDKMTAKTGPRTSIEEKMRLE